MILASERFLRQALGFSLLEVLITVVVISIGLLGLAGIEFTGMRAANSAYEHTLAVHLTQDIAERLHANRAGANSGLYDAVYHDSTTPQSNVACYGASSNCTQTDLRNYDLYQWYQDIQPASGGPYLPNLSIQIQRNPSTFEITLNWGNLSDPGHPSLVTDINPSL